MNPTVDVILEAVMITLEGVFKSPPNESKLAKEMEIDIPKQYNNPASKFEMACYLYFRVDLWAYQTDTPLRPKISKWLLKELNNRFSALLSFDTTELFRDRILLYSSILKEKGSLNGRTIIDGFYFYLIQLLFLTKNGVNPKRFNKDEFSINMDYFSSEFLKINLISWEQAMLPVLIKEYVAKYSYLFEKI